MKLLMIKNDGEYRVTTYDHNGQTKTVWQHCTAVSCGKKSVCFTDAFGGTVIQNGFAYVVEAMSTEPA